MKFPGGKKALSPDGLMAEGDRFCYGIGVDQSFEEAFWSYQKAALKGLPAAMYRLGCMYESGHGTQQSFKKAYMWYDKAALRGDRDAMAALGFLYEQGLGTRQSRALAIENLEKAANMGSVRAMNNLGLIYMYEKRLEYAEHAAVTWFQKGNMQKFPPQTANLARLYETGRGLTRNCTTASNLYRTAAKLGNLPAKIYLAEMLKYGIGVDAKPASAKHLYLEAARWGDPVAKAELEGGDVDVDIFQIVPDTDPNPRTQLAYGLMFLFGCRAPYAPELAFNLLESAAEAGNTDAMYVLGQAYENGIGCRKSIRTAKKWYSWGADKGSGPCAYVLGWMYESGGEYGEMNPELAVTYYRRAVSAENMDDDALSDALYALGQILAVIEPDEGLECLLRSAGLGHPEAQLRAGLKLIEKGDEEGWKLVTAAAAQGVPAAADLLAKRDSGNND